jgi:hypothetical protein
MVAMLSQRDYASRGPSGPTSQYLRNAAMPDMHFQIHYTGEVIKAGAGAAYKSIVPELVTDSLFKTDSKVTGLSAIAFAKLKLNLFTVKLQGVYGQNTADVLQPSGYGVTNINAQTNEKEYAPIQNGTVWMDAHTNGETFRVGVFAGYYQNMGTTEDIAGDIYGLGTNIATMYRLSPRVVYNSGKVRIAAELEYTSADFGNTFDAKAKPVDVTTGSNLRTILSGYYFF